MISKTILKAIDDQIKKEFEASNLYLAMACWFDAMRYGGFAKYMREQSEEERGHAMRFIQHVLDRSEAVIIPSTSEVRVKFDCPADVFKAALAHEQMISKSINEIDSLAVAEKDWTTHEFLSYFVREQVEEEKKADLMARLTEYARNDVAALLALDQKAACDYAPALG